MIGLFLAVSLLMLHELDFQFGIVFLWWRSSLPQIGSVFLWSCLYEFVLHGFSVFGKNGLHDPLWYCLLDDPTGTNICGIPVRTFFVRSIVLDWKLDSSVLTASLPRKIGTLSSIPLEPASSHSDLPCLELRFHRFNLCWRHTLRWIFYAWNHSTSRRISFFFFFTAQYPRTSQSEFRN